MMTEKNKHKFIFALRNHNGTKVTTKRFLLLFAIATGITSGLGVVAYIFILSFSEQN
jgi:hypothetical protein